MIINNDILDELYLSAGPQRMEKARGYVVMNRVSIDKVNYEDEDNFSVSATVKGTENYKTNIEVMYGEIVDVTCQCQDYYKRYSACKHIVATMMQFKNEYAKQKSVIATQNVDTKTRYRSFYQIVNTLFNEEIEKINDEQKQENIKSNITIEPKLIYDKYNKALRLEAKIGDKRLYKIKNYSEFYENFLENKKFKYGAQLEFIHNKEAIKDESKPLLDFILNKSENIKFVNSEANSNYRYYGKALSESSILVNNTSLDELFDILKGQKVIFQKEYDENKVQFIEGDPQIMFELTKTGNGDYKLQTKTEERINDIPMFFGREYVYILKDDIFYRCSKEFKQNTLKVLQIFKENYLKEVYISKEQLPDLYSVIMPKIKKQIEIDEELQAEIQEFKPEKLGVKIYLDFDEQNYIEADVRFCYGDKEINPLDDNEKDLQRNSIEETKALNQLGNTGFMIYEAKKKFILPQEEKIYEFLSNEIEIYMKKFEVMVTEEFKSKQIKQPKIGSIGVKVENNLLSVDLSNINIEYSELEEIMNKYSLKKKYHRLKDGSFLKLDENKELEFIDKVVTGMDLDFKDLEKGKIKLPVHRSLYLNGLLRKLENTQVNKNSEYKEIVRELNMDNITDDIQVPKALENTLRYYQKTAFKWLKILDNYKFGGILADDMGLGKTIQMISIIIDYIENTPKEERKASIVIAPSSLSINWRNECQKFADGIKTMVIRGTASERKRQINQLENYDLIITSYDLLKRDIEVYTEKDYNFRFIIADEAQYLKNSNTQNAKAIKQIKADTKYALTGTPIENSLAELWSIFDFIMPGYLFTYKKFKSMYEVPIIKDNDSNSMEKLKMLIEPFVLRRTKKEVLTELPDKTITILSNEMKDEQEKIYLSYLAQTKQEVAEIINTNGFEKNQIQILAALTRLRQICCHPGLFIDNYQAGSSKLEQCIEIIEEAIEGGHKILLFSGYTSMFDIIEQKLKEKQIKYFKLTGSTKVDERIDLVDEFNNNEDVKVFLISLKAGGTGLNLTGADVVIHYDPWWNSSAENQATDRAYRIGQKKNVQVYKLITKNSIEEKIYELQQKKSALIDNVLDTNTTFINKFTKEDIMKLFE